VLLKQLALTVPKINFFKYSMLYALDKA
jgi:hypothetical protein